MQHTVKIDRALSKAAIGRYPGSAGAMLDVVPAAIVAALTSTQLAALLDATWDACQAAKAIACREAIAEGVIWDTRRQTLAQIRA